MAVLRSTFSSLADAFISDTFADFAKDVDVYSLARTSDGQGGFTEVWSVFASSKAFIFPLKGKENLDSGRLFSDQFYKISLKPISGLTTKMKIIYDGDDFNIRSIVDIAEADAWVNLITEKGVAQ